MKAFIIVGATALLAGCASQPVVTGISDSSVRVLQRMGTPLSDVDAVADRSCRLYGKRAKRLSFSCKGYCLQRYYLYACLKN